MKKYLLLAIYFPPLICAAQNLVPNPSFEDTINCPQSQSEIWKANGWKSFGNSPDYFNTCNGFPASNYQQGVSVPGNFCGYQAAKFGNGYAGFDNANIYLGNVIDREYIGCELLQALAIDQKYFFCFSVTPAYKISDAQLSFECFSNNVGLRFSTVPHSLIDPAPTDNFSHYHYSNILSDTSQWITIGGSFVADSAYSYLTIGNFYDNDHSLIVCDSQLLYSVSYLYVDQIIVSTDSLLCSITSSTQNISSHLSYRIFPNPARDGIAILGSGIISVSLLDIFGGILDIKTASPFHFSLINLPSGIYFINAETQYGIQQQKFIKQ